MAKEKDLDNVINEQQSPAEAPPPAEQREQVEQFDPAQQSLADALRVSFAILKGIMLLLLVIYVVSGVFSVDAGERAVRLRFGQIVGQEGQQVYNEGWHFGLPYPIEQVVTVPTSTRTLGLNQAFMTSRTGNQRNDPLDPLEDGALITGDANLVHGRFEVTYRITDPAAYVRNVGTIELAEELVRSTAEESVVVTVAQTDADTFISGAMDMGPAMRRAQRLLQRMETGITIESLGLTDSQAPAAVQRAFDATASAESTASQRISNARSEEARILREAAGEAALPRADGGNGPLIQLILAYEDAVQRGDTAEAERLSALLDRSFRELAVPIDPDDPDGAKAPIGAEAASVIHEAENYRTEIVQQVTAEADMVRSLSDEFQNHRALLIHRYIADLKEQILTGPIETIYTMSGQTHIRVNRDPEVRERIEQQRMEQRQAEQAEQENQNNN